MNRTVFFAGLASLLSLVVGCAAESDPAPSNGTEGTKSSEIGLANPAAVHCVNLGYKLDNEQCVFLDGSSCEEWAFFRGECSAPTPKPAPAPSCTPIPGPSGGGSGFGLANPASVYCTALGYTWSDGQCAFSDGTSCEEWSFFRGECGQTHSFCNMHGGNVSNVQEDMGGWTASYARCTLPTGVSCEESKFAQNCGCP
jgi:putative hemolysin